jgi:DNA-binding IclR family transcriptional regulator
MMRGILHTSQGPFRRTNNISKTAIRALDVLEYFGRFRQPLRAVHIAREFRLSPSTADQLLKSITRAGYLTFDPISKIYSPSPRLIGFAVWLTADCFWNSDTDKILAQIQNESGADVSLWIRSDNCMQMLKFVKSPKSPFNVVRFLAPFHTVVGQAFLATCPDSEARRIIDRALLFKQVPKGRVKSLVEDIHVVRAAGYARADSIYYPGQSAFAMAVPLRGSAPNKSVVLGITGEKAHLHSKEKTIIDIMHRHAVNLV